MERRVYVSLLSGAFSSRDAKCMEDFRRIRKNKKKKSLSFS